MKQMDKLLHAVKSLAECMAEEVTGPDGLAWIDRPVKVTGGDYEYEGQLLLSFPKGEDGPLRYIVMDQNRRLFIHNAAQCGLES